MNGKERKGESIFSCQSLLEWFDGEQRHGAGRLVVHLDFPHPV